MAITSDDKTLYMIKPTGELIKMDISDKKNFVLISSQKFNYILNNILLIKNDSYLVICTRSDGVIILDTKNNNNSDTSELPVVRQVKNTTNTYEAHVACTNANQTTLFVGTQNGIIVINIVDITTASQTDYFHIVSSYRTSISIRLSFDENFILVSNFKFSLYFVDIRDSSNWYIAGDYIAQKDRHKVLVHPSEPTLIQLTVWWSIESINYTTVYDMTSSITTPVITKFNLYLQI
jgi:hypothetical protein